MLLFFGPLLISLAHGLNHPTLQTKPVYALNPGIIIVNGSVITPHGILPGGSVLIKDGLIAAVSENRLGDTGAAIIDAGGHWVSPGFMDIHVHGAGGHDFMDGSVEAFLEIARVHARFGTTSMFPTTLAGSTENIIQTLNSFEQARALNDRGSELLGMHLEGPYLAMSQRGAQDPKYIRNPDPTEYLYILSTSNFISRWSVAPELPGAIALGRDLTSRSILPSIAHTDAIYEQVADAFQNGYSHVTHLYSAMSGVTRKNGYRFAGAVEGAFLIDDMTVEVIADGIHLPPPLLQLVYKIKGPRKIALITDAMRATGTSTRNSIIGNIHSGMEVIVEDGVSKLPDRSAFAGSVATADRLVKTMIKQAGIPLQDVVRMMTQTPAEIMRVSDRKGSIAIGKDGDIVIFDENINVQMTIINGQIVYARNGDHAPSGY